jgi:hypothetical protein
METPKCTQCGSSKIVPFSREYGARGDWYYWTISGLKCEDCGETKIPKGDYEVTPSPGMADTMSHNDEGKTQNPCAGLAR